MGRLALICLGGALGTGIRYVTALLAAEWLGTAFPYGTLLVNLVGSFIIGFVQQVGTETLILSDDVRLFLTTGMMGGLTTYSAFSYETVRLMEFGSWPLAWLNIVITTALCLGVCFLGIEAAKLMLRG